MVVGYDIDGETVEEYPVDTPVVERATPIVKMFDGWDEDVVGVRRHGDLPPSCRAFIDELCQRVGTPWEILSVGPGREQTITRESA